MLESILIALAVVGVTVFTLLYIENLIKLFKGKIEKTDKKIFSIAAFMWVIVITYILEK